jgi:hypothetical protein
MPHPKTPCQNPNDVFKGPRRADAEDSTALKKQSNDIYMIRTIHGQLKGISRNGTVEKVCNVVTGARRTVVLRAWLLLVLISRQRTFG